MSLENSSAFIALGLILFLFRKISELEGAKIKTVEYDGINEGVRERIVIEQSIAQVFCPLILSFLKWLFFAFIGLSCLQAGIGLFQYGRFNFYFGYSGMLTLLEVWSYGQILVFIYLQGCDAGLQHKHIASSEE
jgi:hypothetical protein